MKLLKIFASLLSLSLLFGAQTLEAKKERVYYTAKSNLIGVSGNYEILERALSGKVEINPVTINTVLPSPENGKSYTDYEIRRVERSLNEEEAGKRVINYLLGVDKYGRPDERLLEQRAVANATSYEIERVQGDMEAIKNNWYPVLSHNYIFLQREMGGKLAYMVFRVDVSKSAEQEIRASWDDVSAYRQIPIPVVYCGSGVVELDADATKLQSKLAAQVPDFAIRGQMLSRASANISPADGAKRGDRVYIYRNENIDGQNVSKRIARGRITGWDYKQEVGHECAHFYRIAGNAGNPKNGDMVVVRPDKKWAMSVNALYQEHLWGIDLNWDKLGGFYKSGLVNHFLINLSAMLTDDPSHEFNDDVLSGESYYHQESEYHAPFMVNFGLGYGLSKNFLAMIDVMPYFMVQGEWSYMINKTHVLSGDDDYASSSTKEGISAFSVNIPVGLRLGINIAYPVQLTLAGGYNFSWGFNSDENYKHSYDTIERALDDIGVNRKGVFFEAGIRWYF